MPGLPDDYHHHSKPRGRRTQANLHQLRQGYDAGLRSTTSPVQGERLGKGLGSFQSPAGSAGSCPPTRSAHLIRRRPKKFTKLDGQCGRPRRGSTVGSINAERKRSAIRLLLATFAEKERKRMTHLKQTTLSLPAQGTPERSYLHTGAATGAEAINPCPLPDRACTGHTPPDPRRQLPGTGRFLSNRQLKYPDRKASCRPA